MHNDILLQDIVTLEIGEILWNKTDGLCGVHDENHYNDFTKPDGNGAVSLSDFVSSWTTGACHDVDEHACAEGSIARQKAEAFCKRLLTITSLEDCREVNHKTYPERKSFINVTASIC